MTEKKLSMQSSIIWNSVGSMFYLGCQWLITVLVVRISGVDTAGILSLAMSVCNIWYCIAIYGMRNFQVSDTQGKYKNGTYVFSRWITGTGAFVGCLIFAMAVSYNTEQRICILLYYIFKFSEALHDVYSGIFQSIWRLDYAGKSMLMRGVLSLVSFVLVLQLTDHLSLAILVMAVLCLAAVALYDIRIAHKVSDSRLDRNMQSVTGVLKECFPLLVYSLLSTAIATIPRLVMERVLGSYQLGIYGSVSTPTLIIQMAATYIFTPFAALFAERYYQKEKKMFMEVLRNCIAAVVVIGVVGIIGGKLFGRWGLMLIYGEEVAAYTELLIPLIVCTILTAFAWLLCGVLTAIRAFSGLVSANVAAVLTSAVLSVLLERKYEMQGASIALAVATLVEVVILFACLIKNTRKQFAEL